MGKRTTPKKHLKKCGGFSGAMPCGICKRREEGQPVLVTDLYEDPETGATTCIHVIP